MAIVTQSKTVDTQSDAGETEMTIDQVAQFAGVPSSTVRMYQNKGLLPPPVRRGRVGFYNGDHRDRLRLIAHLQSRGFSLAAIKESLDSWNAGRSLDHLLGVTDVAPGLVRQPLRLTPAELAERFEGVGVSQADIQRAAKIGLVELDGTDVVISNEAFADMGPRVASIGLSVSEILDEYEALTSAVAAIAARFRTVFETHVWSDFEASGMPPDRIGEITTDVAELTALATNVVTVELHERFAAFADEYISQATDASESR